jgi:uncharacterized protein (DUF362 family)
VERDPVYRSLAGLFASLGWDAARIGRSDWNPLGDWLQPGDRVLIKPNLVFHEHYRGGLLHGVVTDPRLIRAMADFVFRALGPGGELVIGDAPLQSADWDLLCSRTGLSLLPEFYAHRGFHCELRDFRRIASSSRRGLKLAARSLCGDPEGYRAVDLAGDSMHSGRPWQEFRVTNYDPAAMRAHHNASRHEYLIAQSVLDASAVISMPKLKTHRKCGLTGPLKNLIGINGCKDWLPHHTKGSAQRGGDEYGREAAWKRLSTWLVEREETTPSEPAKRALHALRRTVWFAGKHCSHDAAWEGSWHGNDTLWRTVLDLNRAAIYADTQGKMQERAQRRFLVVTDAILAGEGEGPMAPSPVPLGVLLGGFVPAAVELACAGLAEWPVHRLPALAHAFEPHRYRLAAFSDDQVEMRHFEWDEAQCEARPAEPFSHRLAPSVGWRAVFGEPSGSLPPREVSHAG